MASTSLEHPPHQTTAPTGRGLALYRERWQDIEFRNGSWFVPATTETETKYGVWLGPVPVCECAEHAYPGARCPHVEAATLAKAKTSPCSCCGQRVPNRFVTEVEEWHELLSWFPGDLLCGGCIAHGFWS